jgi:methylphosphotriester-DNA--protein-cysteine methyltransferase
MPASRNMALNSALQSDGKPELESARYQALRSHDARFDGAFIVGVSSTGIYCRPELALGPVNIKIHSNKCFYRFA